MKGCKIKVLIDRNTFKVKVLRIAGTYDLITNLQKQSE